jgi:hypothetical protein
LPDILAVLQLICKLAEDWRRSPFKEEGWRILTQQEKLTALEFSTGTAEH